MARATRTTKPTATVVDTAHAAPARRTDSTLTGARKCAVLCVALGPERAGEVLRQLSNEQVERVSAEIATLGEVPPELVQQVLEEFESASQVRPAPRGGPAVAKAILERGLEPARAQELVKQMEGGGGLGRLRQAAPGSLAQAIAAEHPQTAALVVAHLDPPQAVRVLAALGEPMAGEVLWRIARLGPVTPDTLALVEGALSGRVELTLARPVRPAGGAAAVAKLINQAGGSGPMLLAGLQERDPGLGREVEALMFVFEDLLKVDNKGIQRLVREIESRDLALGLRAASDELKRHLKAGMSERAAAALDEEMELLGAVRVKDVEAAHGRIVDVARRLEQEGEIQVQGRGGDDELLA